MRKSTVEAVKITAVSLTAFGLRHVLCDCVLFIGCADEIPTAPQSTKGVVLGVCEVEQRRTRGGQQHGPNIQQIIVINLRARGGFTVDAPGLAEDQRECQERAGE